MRADRRALASSAANCSIGIVAKQAQKTRSVGADEVPEIGRGFGDAADEPRKRGIVADEAVESSCRRRWRLRSTSHADTRVDGGDEINGSPIAVAMRETRGTKPPDQRCFIEVCAAAIF